MTEANQTRYIATYEFDRRAWVVQFRGIGIATLGRTLAAAKRYARSALAVHLGSTTSRTRASRSSTRSGRFRASSVKLGVSDDDRRS